MGQRVLVTGGLGFIGRNLSEALLQRGDEVRILDDLSRGSQRLLREAANRFEILHGDVRDEAAVRNAVRGCDRVYHLAAINGTKNFYTRPKDVLEVGILGTLRVIQAIIEAGVEEFLFMSSSETYQTPPTLPTDESVPLCIPDVTNPRYSYGGAKIAGELMAINFGRADITKAIIVRPHNVYGPNMGYDHVIPELAKSILVARRVQQTSSPTVPLLGGGSATRAFVYIDDFIAGTLLAMDKGTHLGIYHVGTDTEISIMSLARRIALHLACSVTFESRPVPAGEAARRCPDITKLQMLGYRPKVNLDEGLQRMLPSVIQNIEDEAAYSEREGG